MSPLKQCVVVFTELSPDYVVAKKSFTTSQTGNLGYPVKRPSHVKLKFVVWRPLYGNLIYSINRPSVSFRLVLVVDLSILTKTFVLGYTHHKSMKFAFPRWYCSTPPPHHPRIPVGLFRRILGRDVPTRPRKSPRPKYTILLHPALDS